MTGERVDELVEELLRRGIDPVDVLDDEHNRAPLAGPQEDVAHQRVGALLDLGAQPGEQFRRRADAEEMGEQRHRLVVHDADGA